MDQIENCDAINKVKTTYKTVRRTSRSKTIAINPYASDVNDTIIRNEIKSGTSTKKPELVSVSTHKALAPEQETPLTLPSCNFNTNLAEESHMSKVSALIQLFEEKANKQVVASSLLKSSKEL